MVPANLSPRSVGVLSGESQVGERNTLSTRHSALSTGFLLLACWLLTGVSGCVGTAPFLQQAGVAPCPAACQVVATWYPEVVSTPDPTHGGTPTWGLAGRVYLFGPEISYPLVGDGTMVVDLYNDTSDSNATVPLEEWRFDKDTLKRLQRRDAVGSGYTLFLPWGTYQPQIKRVRLRVRYEPAKGAPLYSESPAITLKKESS